jgi:proteasome accessory factor C
LTPAPAADERLERILLLLPIAAHAVEGIELETLAAHLGVTREQVLADIQEVVAREYYHPAGRPIDIDVLIEGERMTLWTSGEFQRPPRLSPAEGLALGLGLRLLAESATGDRRERVLDLARRLGEELTASAPPVELYALDAGDSRGDGMLDLLRRAAEERRRCRLQYLKPGDPASETRLVHPYTLVFAGGMWYVIGWSEERAGVRAFRLDRILAAEVLDGEFERPRDFRAEDYVEDGVVFRAGQTVEAAVRYSPRVARWLLERGAGEEQANRSVVCRYTIADPGWLVRHALWYGPDAEVLEPAPLREAVRAALERSRESRGDYGS